MTSSDHHSIFIVSDHPLEILGLQAVLSDVSDLQFVGHSNDSADAIKICMRERPSIVILSLVLPGLAPTLVVRELISNAGADVICMASIPDSDLMRSVLSAGALGIVQRRDPTHAVLDAIQTVARGERYLTNGVQRLFSLGERETNRNPRPSNGPKPLTPREREVLKLIADGNTTSEIAERLTLSVKTIETHRKNVMDKLQTRSIAQLTKLAIQSGLTTIDN